MYDRRSASYVSIRPSPNIPLPGTTTSVGPVHHRILTDIESTLLVLPGQATVAKQGGVSLAELSGENDDIIGSKQQKAYEELKISILLCGEYLSNFLLTGSKSITINPTIEEAIRSSLQSSLDTDVLTTISSRRKKDIILTGKYICDSIISHSDKMHPMA